ncbi:RNA cytidine acetyltransferase [Octopus sinensis]|uniref:RNA cytidine acetyltransferase n=1 Tax=Octopus sinensis TaxID=2607531 RepID=A0A6P7S5A4_9MOLL|nr:RNA cytidine acetyltransferase [Octopus sinensis]
MTRKKIDNRIKTLIENGVAKKHRTMFVVVADQGHDQIVVLHHMLTKAEVKARPSVLWCYKKELGFSSHGHKKRMRKMQKKIKTGRIATMSEKDADAFELFLASTNIRYCYYKETHKILGNTYGMCVLQDFEALTPNLLARTVETVEGGGLIVILLRTMKSLKQLYTMTMDVHSRFRTESHQEVTGRFNERFLLSLTTCSQCLVIDNQYNILPLSSLTSTVTPLPKLSKEESLSQSERELVALKESLQDTQPVGAIINCARTLDQAKGLLKFIDSVSEKTLRNTVVMTAARGRGKSAALGLAMATAVGFGYSNIFVTSPSPENLKTLFEFIFKGFDVLEYQEHIDYEIIQSSNPDFNKAIVRVNIFRDHRQTIQYIHPTDAHKLGQAELVCIDEAAAIPLPLVKELIGPYLVFMSSTVNGYEGTGRSLSLKLIQQLRQQAATFSGTEVKKVTAVESTTNSLSGRVLYEVQLNESIRYADGDPVEKWLNDLLCLDVTNVRRITSGCPLPQDCDLYYVNRDTLFSFHKGSEAFLHRIMSLYVSSHYKNTPNDLQMLSDAPAHHIFVLLGPMESTKQALPEVLCVVQMCLEGDISKAAVMSGLRQGKRASGDLIPWTISQQFQDNDFASLSGVRVVRIATHPDYQKMGYGSRALQLLSQYYKGEIVGLNEDVEEVPKDIEPVDDEEIDLLEEKPVPRKNLPPLLLKLTERPPEQLDYMGVSFGLTADLLKFWKRNGFVPVYLRQTANDLTGEHSCIMLKALHDKENESNTLYDKNWLLSFWKDFRRRFISLCSYQFRSFSCSTALSILQQKHCKEEAVALAKQELDFKLTVFDLKRLELYSQNMIDYHLIMDLMPTIAELYYLQRLPDLHLSAVQQALLLGIGLQHKTVDDLEKNIGLAASQLLGLYNRIIRKVVQHLNSIVEKSVEQTLIKEHKITMEPVAQTLDDELDAAAIEVKEEMRKKIAPILEESELSQFAVKGDEDQWNLALSTGKKNLKSISIKSIRQKRQLKEVEDNTVQKKSKKFKKSKKHK